MPNSVAEAYLLILRSSMVPVVGEAVPIPFNEQIELDEWSWELKHEEESGDKGDKGDKKTKTDKPKESSGPTARETAEAGETLVREVSNIHRSNLSVDEKNRQVIAKIKKANEERTKADKDAESDDASGSGDNKLKFTFKKNVDAATTQLLNSMKAGEVMPRAVVSLYHRSTNAPVLLTVKFETVKLVKYDLSVEVTDTMSDMKETWEATYEAVDYVYKNRPAASGSNMATQGTARVFKMKSGSLI